MALIKAWERKLLLESPGSTGAFGQKLGKGNGNSAVEGALGPSHRRTRVLARNLLKGLLHFKAFRQRLIHQSVKEKLNEEMSEVHLVSELEKGAEVEEELGLETPGCASQDSKASGCVLLLNLGPECSNRPGLVRDDRRISCRGFCCWLLIGAR